jgi:hypothetical protein
MAKRVFHEQGSAIASTFFVESYPPNGPAYFEPVYVDYWSRLAGNLFWSVFRIFAFRGWYSRKVLGFIWGRVQLYVCTLLLWLTIERWIICDARKKHFWNFNLFYYFGRRKLMKHNGATMKL